jgi:hypothetical protein
MKKLLFSTIFVCLGAVAFGQVLPNVQFGIKGGANLSKFSTDNPLNSDNKAGYYAGFWARIGAAGIHLQPELYLSGKNATLTRTSDGAENEVRFTSVDVPILVGTKIGAAGIGFRLNTGPVFSYILNDKQKVNNAVGKAFSGDFKNQNIAWQFGAGLDIMKLGVDLRYEQGLSKIGKDEYESSRIGLFTLGLAYRLF